MSPHRRATALCLALALLVGTVAAQTSAPASTSAPACSELPPDVAAALSGAADYTYDFNYAGYYALLAFVKHSPQGPGFACPPLVVDDWQELVERPTDFRGRPVTIEGVVGRNKSPYTHPSHPELGQFWQVELSRTDQAASCTVIFTNNVSDLPLHCTIRVTGYFVQMRRFPTKTATPGIAALLIAQGPTQVSELAPAQSASALDWRWLTAAIVAALLVTFVLLRRSARAARHDVHQLTARREAPMNLADDLAEWADKEKPEE